MKSINILKQANIFFKIAIDSSYEESSFDEELSQQDLETALDFFEKDYISNSSYYELLELEKKIEKEIDEVAAEQLENDQVLSSSIPIILEEKLKLVRRELTRIVERTGHNKQLK